MLFLDLRKLHGHLVDLLLVVLQSGCVVRWLEKCVLFNKVVRTIVDLEFLLHNSASRALQLRGARGTFSTVTVHLN